MVQTIAQQFNAGGPFMWALLAVLGIAVAVMLERILYFFIFCRGNGAAVASRLIGAIRAGDLEKAEGILGKRSTPLFVLLRTAMKRYRSGMGVEKVREGIEEAAIVELPKTGQRLNYLSLFANIATLLGLLGTIAGLQTSFSSLASVDAAQKATMLATGISQAMNTTAFGLIVAIPCMVMYTILNNKQQSLLKDIDDAVVRVVNTLKDTAA
jgi:biopolymer transport protein ExbB/TolQ